MTKLRGEEVENPVEVRIEDGQVLVRIGNWVAFRISKADARYLLEDLRDALEGRPS